MALKIDTVEIATESAKIMSKKRTRIGRVFYGQNGLRIIWSILLFIALYAFFDFVTNVVLNRISWLSVTEPILPTVALVRESCALATVLGTTFIMSKIERRNLGSFGYLTKDRLKRFLTGITIGLLSLSALIAMMWKFGFIIFTGFSLHGLDIIIYGGIWAIVFVMIGILEESIFRGYLQYTLARGIGFWPAALLVSAGFILWHLSNKSESILGLITTGVGSIVFSLSLYYTKSLWWAIGFHAGWDWGQNFFYGTPDSGIITQGHLFNTHAVGDPFWSGGSVGPEGSAFFLPLLLVVLIGIWLSWHPKQSRI